MAEILAFLKLDGVEGETGNDHYTEHLELQSFSWGASNNSSYSTGTGPGVGAGQVHNMSFSKFMCKASPKLMERVIKGWTCDTGKLILCKRNSPDGKPLEYYTVDMENVIITSYQMSASGGAQLPMESFSLDFVVIKPNYVAQADDGSGKDNHGFGWHLQKGKEA
jgi:type VI secretion system secreted protein Hcp